MSKNLFWAGCLSLLLSSLIASSAEASTVTVGQLFPPTSCDPSHTLVQTGVSSGTSYTLPSSGLITSWSFQDGSTTVSGLKLKVAQPTSGVNNFAIRAESAAGTQAANMVNTYSVAIPVQAGDLLGVYAGVTGQCLTSAGMTSADIVLGRGADEPPGSMNIYSPTTGVRIPVSVTLQPTPGITLISPGSGSVLGGTAVTIAGHDFNGASAVSFGNRPAKSFTVDSDNAIRALSPPAASPGAVDVHVTTAAGTSPALVADRYMYTGCVVPKLRGKHLSAARKRLTRANCRLGKVVGPSGGSATVTKQRPKPGAVLPPGGKVRVTTG